MGSEKARREAVKMQIKLGWMDLDERTCKIPCLGAENIIWLTLCDLLTNKVTKWNRTTASPVEPPPHGRQHLLGTVAKDVEELHSH